MRNTRKLNTTLKRAGFSVLTVIVGVLVLSPGVRAAVGEWSSSGSTIFYKEGNVGIGNNMPSGILDVGNKGVSDSAGHFVVDESRDAVYVGRLSSQSGANTKNFIIRNRVGAELLNIDLNAGVTNAAGLLSLKNNNEVVRLSNTDGRQMTIGRLQGGAGTGSWEFKTNDDYTFYTDSVARFKIDNAGVHAREIRVNNTWADYVFEDGYKLLSLSQVENFIKQNGHLPGVPSAEEIVESGLALGDISRIQMEKIEELTLYTIAQENKIKDLESRIEVLEEKLN